jgi:DNA-binding Lrp family transcriptional regulator
MQPERSNLTRPGAQLSPADREIVRILQDNGRASSAHIARELGITEKSVRKRVAQLVDNEVIEIITVTDPEVLGYHAMALVALRLDPGRRPSHIAAELAEIPGVDYVVLTTGRFHALVEVLAPDTAGLTAIVEESILAVEGIAAREVFPYLRLQYQEPRWEAARWKSDNAGVASGHRLDAVDRRVLRELSADGRAPFQSIADTLGVSESQVRQRVNRMLESGTMRVLAITNPASLGFQTIAWVGIVATPDVRIADLAARVAAVASITYVVVSAGRFDVFAEAICVDHEDLLSVLDDQIRTLPGVARTEAFLAVGLHHKRLPAVLAT